MESEFVANQGRFFFQKDFDFIFSFDQGEHSGRDAFFSFKELVLAAGYERNKHIVVDLEQDIKGAAFWFGERSASCV
jgi:hypothetical protein